MVDPCEQGYSNALRVCINCPFPVSSPALSFRLAPPPAVDRDINRQCQTMDMSINTERRPELLDALYYTVRTSKELLLSHQLLQQ